MGIRQVRIADLAWQVWLSTAMLRYCENEGLPGPVSRTEAGCRMYGDDALQRVGFIQCAKDLGLALRDPATTAWA